MKISVIILSLLPFLCCAQVETKGTEFWLGYMESLTLDFNNSPSFFIEVYGETGGTGLISAPASPGIEVAFTYNAGEVTKVDLPLGVLYAQGSEQVANFGFKIETSTRVTASAAHARWYFSEASMLLPTPLLSSNYHVLAIPDINLTASSYSSFVIVSTKDNSTVEITPSVLTIGFHGPGATFSVVLNEGESYQVQALGDLSGTVINEINGNGLAVFGGAKQADVHCTLFADNHIWDQMYPDELLGLEYAVVPYMGQGLSVVKILATQDNTEISINSNIVTTLQSGQTYDYPLTEASMLVANEPIQVALVNPSFGCISSEVGDPNMTILAPTDYVTYGTKFWHDDFFALGFEKKYFVTLTSSVENPVVQLDGQDIGGDFNSINGASGYFYCEKEINVGEHELIAPSGVLGYAYALADYDAYTYHLGYQTPISTGIDEVITEPILVSSNPVHDVLRLTNNSNNNISNIKLWTIQGKIMSEEFEMNEQESMNMDVSHAAPGLYFLTYQSNGIQFEYKLFIEK